MNDLFSNDEAQIIELEEESIISSSDESGNSCPKLVEPIKASKHNDALPNLPINYIEDDKIMPMFYVSNSELSQLAIFYNCLDRKSVVLKLSGTIFFNGILKIKPLFNR